MSSEALARGFAALSLTLALGVAVAAPAHAAEPERIELTLNIGEQKVLPSAGVRSYSEGIKGIVDVRLTRDNSQFVIVGLKPGRTTVLFLQMDGSEVHYEIDVVDPNAVGTASSMAAPEDMQGKVEERDNIRLDFYFVQFSESYGHDIGVGWPSSIGNTATFNLSYDVQGGAVRSATAVVANQVLPRLDMAQSSGWAKLLRKAAVITANGTQATFSGGGEVNVPISGGFGGDLRQIEFGSKIGVKPRYDRESGRIELEIQADVSDLTDDNGTGVPGRTTSTLQTVVNLELGQSLVLAGLTARNETGAKTGLPGLSQIPILGLLFGTNSSRSQDTENLVFIVPSVIDNASQQSRALIDEALAAYEEYSGDIEDAPTMPPAPTGAPSHRPAGAAAPAAPAAPASGPAPALPPAS